VDKAFVATGENIISEDYTIDLPSKGTIALSGMAQGDPYARILEVYADGIIKYQNAVINNFNIQVNLGFLESGRHVVGVKIPTSIGSWLVNGTVILDRVEVPDIAPFVENQDTWDMLDIEPSRTITGPSTLAPPETDLPVRVEAPVERGIWDWLTKPSKRLFPTQDEIDVQGRELARIKVAAENLVPHVNYLDAVPPSQDFVQSNSVPLSVQAMNDRLKDIPTGNLPQFDFPSGTLGSPEYGPTEMPYLANSFHKDNFGRDVVSFAPNFSAETNMILLGAGVAAIIAAAAFYQRDTIAKYLKR
jgi:hypothetical protein